MPTKRTHKKLPRAHLAGIGAVTVAWSHMEENLGNVLMNLGAINAHVSQAISINMGNQALLDTIRIIANAFCQDAELVVRWNALLDKIQEVRGERNRIVHGMWTWRYEYPDIYSVAVIDFAAKGVRITGSALQRTPESLHAIAANVFALIDNMQALVLATIPMLAPPLRDAPRGIHVVHVEPDKRMKRDRAKQNRGQVPT